MGIFSKKEKVDKPKADMQAKAAKIASPILKAVYYIMLVTVLLAGIVALIMLLVNTTAKEMPLPPFMELEDGIYSITLGNGVKISSACDNVGVGDIKAVIYAQLLMLVCACATIAPISLFLSKLTKKISLGECDEKCTRYITFIGLCVIVGCTALCIANCFYNFLALRAFVTDPQSIRFALSVPFGTVAAGLLIIAFANMYAGAFKKRAVPDTAEPDAEE